VVNGLMKIGPGAPVKALPIGPLVDQPAPPPTPKQG
jgi:hypothetical protein